MPRHHAVSRSLCNASRLRSRVTIWKIGSMPMSTSMWLIAIDPVRMTAV
jgi:hypothetical protein